MAAMCIASSRTSSPSREASLPAYPGSLDSFRPSRSEGKMHSIPEPRLCRAGIGSARARLGFQSLEWAPGPSRLPSHQLAYIWGKAGDHLAGT